MIAAERTIENLIYRYAELIDAGELAAVAELFRNACIIAPNGSETIGYEAVLAMYQAATRIYPDTGNPCTQHVTSNVRIELDSSGKSAEAHSKFTVFQALPDFPLQAIIAGRYRDSFKLQDGGWQFQCREIHPELLGDLSRHLLFDASRLS